MILVDQRDPRSHRPSRLRPSTIVHAILARAAEAPRQMQLELHQSGGAPLRWTRGDLLHESQRFLSLYRSRGLTRGDVVLVGLHEKSTEVPAYLGAMLGGLIPAVLPRTVSRSDHAGFRTALRALAGQVGAKALMIDAHTCAGAALAEDALGIAVLTDDALEGCWAADLGTLPEGVGEDVALLQFTHDGPGPDRAVALSHRALCNQTRHYAQAMHTSADDVIVSPLSLAQGMGLMAGLLHALTSGARLVMVSRHVWVNRPAALLDAISASGATLCWLPDIAFGLLVLRVPAGELEGCDLSSLRAVINGSPRCRLDVMRDFTARYQPYGLDPAALGTCYAVAENGFAVVQTPVRAAGGGLKIDRVDAGELLHGNRAVVVPSDAEAVEVVSCGQAVDGTHVRIVATDGDEAMVLPEGRVGEIAITSDALFSGYYEGGRLQSWADDGWLRTGELGYVREDELYMLGRETERIHVAGREAGPGTIEAIASSVRGVEAGSVLALDVPADTPEAEKVVVLFEPCDDSGPGEAEREIRRRIACHAACQVDEVIPVPRHWFVRTANGAISRAASRDRFLAMRERDASNAIGGGLAGDRRLHASSLSQGLRILSRAEAASPATK